MLEFILIGIMFGVLFTLLLARVLFNPYKMANFKSTMTKKRFGVVYFHGYGNNFYPRVMCLDNDTIKTKMGTFIIQRDRVYRQVGDVKGLKEESLKNVTDKHGNKITVVKHATIEENKIKFQAGVPVINFDINDMLPLEYKNQIASGETRQPKHVEAVLGKEKALYQLLALKMTKRSIIGLLIVCLIISGMAAALGVINYTTASESKTLLLQINSSLAVVGG